MGRQIGQATVYLNTDFMLSKVEAEALYNQITFLLARSLSTIKRDDSYPMKPDIALLTRGIVEDIGRGRIA